MKISFTILLLITFNFQIMAQKQSTFIYELTLFEPYQHRSQWSEKEHQIQQSHVAYLDSLTKAGKVQLAGIMEQGLEGHRGFVLLNTSGYEEARKILNEDPSVKNGMMKASLRSVNIYFKEE